MSQVQRVKDATDIVEVIGERIQLQKAGSNWRALCPFHSEKSPSFFVSETLQRYKCFGCGESGDVFTFLEKYEGMTFGEALKVLAERAGITLKEFRPSQEDDQRDQLLAVLNLAKEYYHYLLTKHRAGKKARLYLKDRSTTQDSIRLFQLGFALPSWDGLIKFLHKKKKYPLDILLQAGLVIKGRGGRYYDRFRDRIIFPLTNHRGQVVGFSGRVLSPTTPGKNNGQANPSDRSEAKYINTPETALYHKSELLYGYRELLQSIRKSKEVIVTEGEFDVISSVQAHANNIVAIKGSAFTPAHAKLLKRIVERVILALDADAAGVQATKRAIAVAQVEDLELRVIDLSDLPYAKDPDDLARSDPKAWRDAVASAVSVYEFLLGVALKNHDVTKPEGKREVVKDLALVFGNISHAVEQDYYYQELAKALNVRVDLVKKDIDRVKSRVRPATKGAARLETSKQKKTKVSSLEKLERYLWFLLLRSKVDQIKNRATQLKNVSFVTKGMQTLLSQLLKYQPNFELESFSKFIAEDLQELLFDLHLNPEHLDMLSKLNITQEWSKTLKKFKQSVIKVQIKSITQELDELDKKRTKTPDEEERQNELLKKIVLLKK